jgi:Flp pilus assembly protein TadG
MSLEPAMEPRRRGRFESLRLFLRGSAGERAMAATEFALILPVALIMFTGSLIYGTASEVNRKVTLTARDVTDLVTQYTSISTADMATLINSAAQVMYPFPTANTKVVISDVTVLANGTGTIEWSVALSGSGLPVGPVPNPLPANIQAIPAIAGLAQINVIWGHVAYVYTPTIGYQVTGPITLSDDIYLSPRLSADVQYPSATGQSTP